MIFKRTACVFLSNMVLLFLFPYTMFGLPTFASSVILNTYSLLTRMGVYATSLKYISKLEKQCPDN